jgi:glutathione peroxidase
MRMLCLLNVVGFTVVAVAGIASAQSAGSKGDVSSLYDLKTSYLDGRPADLGAFRGKVTLVVNVASECGYTPQYEGLEKLHRELSAKGFSMLGFPSNDFGEQEPGSAQEIAAFCKRNYGVTFPMFSKLVTTPGPDQSPIYRFLGRSGHLPAWNFSKYVVDKHGRVAAFFPSEVTPESAELHRAIAAALAAN